MKAVRLPLILNEKNRYTGCSLLMAFVVFIYFFTNHNPTYEPTLLSMTEIDHLIPFLPNSFWIYISMVPMYFIALYSIQNLYNLNILFYGNLFIWVGSCVFFLFFPTTFPRADYILDPETVNNITYISFHFWRSNIDTPVNCFPSLHVASCLFAGLLFSKENTFKFLVFFSWAVLISLSTITTKQHYLVDVLAGAVVGGSVFMFTTLKRFQLYEMSHRQSIIRKIIKLS